MKRSRERHADRRRLRRAITDQHRRWVRDAVQRALTEMLAVDRVPYRNESGQDQTKAAKIIGRAVGVPVRYLTVEPPTLEDRAQRRIRATVREPIEVITVTLNVGRSERRSGEDRRTTDKGCPNLRHEQRSPDNRRAS